MAGTTTKKPFKKGVASKFSKKRASTPDDEEVPARASKRSKAGAADEDETPLVPKILKDANGDPYVQVRIQ